MPRKLNTPEKRARIGERIKIAATQAGLSLKDLARQTEMSPASIYQYVRGIIAVPDATLERIASLTRVHTDFFDPEQDARSTLALQADTPGFNETGVTASEPGTRSRIEAEFRHLERLFELVLCSGDKNALLVSNLDQMLALARTLEIRKREGWILWQIGRILLQRGEYREANRKLTEAAEISHSEGDADTHIQMVVDLAECLMKEQNYDAAKQRLEAAALLPSSQRWKALLSLSDVSCRKQEFSAALIHLVEAANLIRNSQNEPNYSCSEQQLRSRIADVAYHTGHLEAAGTLYNRMLEYAIDQPDYNFYLSSASKCARCALESGRWREARSLLLNATHSSHFIIDENDSTSALYSLLVLTELRMGLLEEAKISARSAHRIAQRSESREVLYQSTLALAEVRLKSKNFEEAQEYIDEAWKHRIGSRKALSQIHEFRARLQLALYEKNSSKKSLAAAQKEAGAALETAEKYRLTREQIVSLLTLAEFFRMKGDDGSVQASVRNLLEMIEHGAVPLSELVGYDLLEIELLPDGDDSRLSDIFAAGQRLCMPDAEWQALYLMGSAASRTSGQAEAFPILFAAAKIAFPLLSTLTREEASRLIALNPRYKALMDELKSSVQTAGEKKQVNQLLSATHRL